MRSCERVFKRPFKTVKRIVAEVGDWAIDFQKSVPPVPSEFIQADEIWSFIGENDRGSLKKPEERRDRGVSWTWLAIDKTTKLVLTYHIGPRQLTDATIFMRKLKARLKKDERGQLMVTPTLSVDGHRAYVDAIELAFGNEINAGKLVKIYSKIDKETGEVLPGARYKGSIKEKIVGEPDFAEVSTWRIERENGFLRQANRRFTRKTNAFSKSARYHERQVAIWMLYRNFCWQPYPMRPRDGSQQWEKRVTPAMAANLTDHIWEVDELVTASDQFQIERGVEAHETVKEIAGAANDDGSFAFWVSHSVAHRRATVHEAWCTSCNNGAGKKTGGARSGVWRGFQTLDDATTHAATVQPDSYKCCTLCITKSYNTLRSFGPRR